MHLYLKTWFENVRYFAGYSQQMMPPPMGPNHMNYGPGGKMPPNNMSGPAGNYQPYNSQYQPQPGKYI